MARWATSGPDRIRPTWSSWYAVGAVVGRTWATQRNSASAAVVRRAARPDPRHPEQQVGEGQVGDQLPVAGEPVQVVDVGRAEAGVLLDRSRSVDTRVSVSHGAGLTASR